jgi:hypothetical protein
VDAAKDPGVDGVDIQDVDMKEDEADGQGVKEVVLPAQQAALARQFVLDKGGVGRDVGNPRVRGRLLAGLCHAQSS